MNNESGSSWQPDLLLSRCFNRFRRVSRLEPPRIHPPQVQCEDLGLLENGFCLGKTAAAGGRPRKNDNRFCLLRPWGKPKHRFFHLEKVFVDTSLHQKNSEIQEPRWDLSRSLADIGPYLWTRCGGNATRKLWRMVRLKARDWVRQNASFYWVF